MIGVILVAVLAVVLLSGGDGGGDNQSASPRRRARRPASRPRPPRPRRPRPRRPRRPRPRPRRRPRSPRETPAPSGGGTDLDKARDLQLAGFNARQSGDYEQSLALSQQALDACGNSNELDPCGYALFEKGLALSKLDRPDEAIPVLEERLARFGDNENKEVSKELKAAKKAAKG